MNLGRFPRLRFGHLPTPLEPLENLTRELGGPDIWIKRDDCTGLATGGNKTRKLEFLMAEAKEQDADIVLTQGATQSNHARQTAAFAAPTASPGAGAKTRPDWAVGERSAMVESALKTSPLDTLRRIIPGRGIIGAGEVAGDVLLPPVSACASIALAALPWSALA